MSVTPQDQVLRRQLHQLRDAPETLKNLADWLEHRGYFLSPTGQFSGPETLRNYANAIQYVLDNVNMWREK